MTATHDPAQNLAHNARTLREGRGLSQAQIAKLAGVPRPTWTNLESGGANPTLAVLLKVAQALHVSLEELLGAPRSVGKHFAVEDLRVRKRQGVVVRKLLPEAIPGLEIERMEFGPKSAMTGVPHTEGTREYLTCERGTLELSVGGERFTLKAGEVVVFRGDQRHGYRNRGTGTAIGYAVVTFAGIDAVS